jgi:hypothetical protein
MLVVFASWKACPIGLVRKSRICGKHHTQFTVSIHIAEHKEYGKAIFMVFE